MPVSIPAHFKFNDEVLEQEVEVVMDAEEDTHGDGKANDGGNDGDGVDNTAGATTGDDVEDITTYDLAIQVN